MHLLIEEIIETLASISSSKEKLAFLGKQSENELLKRIFYLAYSPRIKFYIKKIPEYTSLGVITLEGALSLLSDLYLRHKTGNDAIQHLQMILNNCSASHSKIIKGIIGKDLKCGVNSSTINKVWKGLIEETPYMGAIPYNKKKASLLFNDSVGVISNEKLDGRYCNTIISSDKIVHEARSGEITYLNDTFDFLLQQPEKDIVLNGELIIDGVDRYTSNGMIASLISIFKKEHNSIDTTKERLQFRKKYFQNVEDILESVIIVCWDLITLSEYENSLSTVIYQERFKRLQAYIEAANNSRLRLVDNKIVHSLEEALADFKEKLQEGKEGTILKGLSEIWKDGKPNWQIKLKLELSVDLKIVGFKPGKKGTRLENTLGALIVESEDGLLQTDPSGISDEMRDYIWQNQHSLLNSIVEIKCCGTSIGKNSSVYSLLHPCFIKLRDDKIIANTLPEILEIENSVKLF